MSPTRKHYVAVAEALRSTRMGDHDNYDAQWHADVEVIANVLAADNPRFDRERFVKACQGEVK